MPARKPKPEQQADQIINVQGGIHAGRDVIQGNQTNITHTTSSQTTNIQTPVEFIAALQEIQAQIAELKLQQLTSAQRRNIEVVEGQIIDVVKEAQQPAPLGERVKTTLIEAKETMELLSGSLAAAATLGTTLGGLGLLAIKVFGG